LPQKKKVRLRRRGFFFKTGNSKSKEKSAASSKAVRKSLTAGNLTGTNAVNKMAVTRDYNKPLTEDQPYLVQVTLPSLSFVGVEWVE
jgi:hypothetical protein